LFETKWDNYVAYVCNLVAAFTGMRKGELLGLQLKDIKENIIEVTKGWDCAKHKLNSTTKTGLSRTILVNDSIRAEIENLISQNPYKEPESFLFYSTENNDKPIYHKIITKHFYRALARSGIDETTRNERGICFHSHRHFANTYMIESGIPLMKVQQLTGHLTDQMSSHYYHVNKENMSDVLDAQNKLFLN
jgi:integrase